MLGAGSVPDRRERERLGRTQCLVLEACLTAERERETGQGTVLGAGSVPDHRERDGAGHSAWCWKCA